MTRKARLRFDPISHEHLLLSPERGLILNGTANEIVQLCTGAYTVAMMIDILGIRHPDLSRISLAQELDEFLFALQQRGLIHEATA